MKKAFYVATTGRPGPVLVDLPKDITITKTDFHYPKKVKMRSYNPTVKGHPGTDPQGGGSDPVRQAADDLHRWRGDPQRRPAELTELTQLLGYPITNTLMGLGAYPATDRQFIGMLGMHGTYEANMAMHECDVLIAIGARFDDRVTGKLEKFCPTAKIVHVDIDPSSISKNVQGGCADRRFVPNVLRAMINVIRQRSSSPMPQALRPWWGRSMSGGPSDRCVPTAKRRGDQAAVRDREALPTHGRQYDRHLRCGPASDVGGAVLSLRPAAALDQLRRAGHHGFWPAGGDGRQARPRIRTWPA
jgi:thiamine pyrophosphate-dependent acetolactate synthase large subunit-like protein